MNRVLRFRAYNIKLGKWEFGYEYPSLGGFSLTGEVVLMGELNSVDLHDILFEQFIGMLDKNTKEIYEGDICNYEFWIQTSIDPDSLGQNFKGSGVVEFIEGCFMINPLSSENPIPFHYENLTMEIIGNIHENPELIKNK